MRSDGPGAKQIIPGMRRLWEVLKIIVEPSGAVPYAAMLATARRRLRGRRVGIVLTGGNLDLDHLPWMVPAPALGPAPKPAR